MLPFLIVGGIGVLLVLISLLLGDIFDSIEVGDGLFSATSLGVGAIVFGASGTLTLSGGLELVWAYVLAVVLALAAYILTAVLIRSLSRSSDGVPATAVGLRGFPRSSAPQLSRSRVSTTSPSSPRTAPPLSPRPWARC